MPYGANPQMALLRQQQQQQSQMKSMQSPQPAQPVPVGGNQPGSKGQNQAPGNCAKPLDTKPTNQTAVNGGPQNPNQCMVPNDQINNINSLEDDNRKKSASKAEAPGANGQKKSWRQE